MKLLFICSCAHAQKLWIFWFIFKQIKYFSCLVFENAFCEKQTWICKLNKKSVKIIILITLGSFDIVRFYVFRSSPCPISPLTFQKQDHIWATKSMKMRRCFRLWTRTSVLGRGLCRNTIPPKMFGASGTIFK